MKDKSVEISSALSLPEKQKKSSPDEHLTDLSEALNIEATISLNSCATHPLQMLCLRVIEPLKKFTKNDQLYDNRPGKKEKKGTSKLSEDRKEVRLEIAKLTEELTEFESDLIKIKSDIEKGHTLTSGPLLELQRQFEREKNAHLLKIIGSLSKKLDDINHPLQKAVNAAYAKEKRSEKANKEIIKGNIGIGWEEALDNVGLREDLKLGCKMDVNDYAKVKAFLDENVTRNRMYFYMEEVLLHLDRDPTEQKGLTKLLLENVPIIQVREGTRDVYMDARVLLNDPAEAYAFVMLDTETTKRKGGGRPQGSYKMKEEHVEYLRQVIESSDVSAQGRRRDGASHTGNIVGGMSGGGEDVLGSNWSLFHKNLEKQFFQVAIMMRAMINIDHTC